MFRFVSDNVGGVGTKRKQTHRPCESCKKRHKRCPHGQEAPTDASGGERPADLGGNVSNPSVPEDVPTTVPSIQGAESAQLNESRVQSEPPVATRSDPSPSSSKHPRSDGAYLFWFSDLAPEASFLVNESAERDGIQRRTDIGLWLGQKPDDQAVVDADEPEVKTVTVEPIGGPAFRLTGLTGIKPLYAYLRRECMCVLPPPHEFALMSSLYFSKIDPIYPILHGEILDEYNALDQAVLKQCICLAASLDPSLRPHLKLGSSRVVLSQSEFRASLAAAVKQSLDAGFVRDKMAALFATALMSFYTDKKHTSEVSAFYCAQAVCLTQDMALHLGWPGDGNSTPRSRRIFWCIWTLDRLCAGINGRALLFHHQDVDERVWEAVEEQIPAFRAFILICKFLDSTISLYRPQSTATRQPLEQPRSFEDLVAEANAGDISNALLVSLELFYLAVVILQGRSLKTDANSDRLPSSSLQFYCASSIISIVSGEFKSSLSYWAVVPYTVSLACSIAYKSLRNSSMSYKKKEAYVMFQSSCDILDELSKSFASAQIMASIAKSTLHEVERVSTSRSKGKSSDGRREEPPVENMNAAGSNIATEVRPLTSRLGPVLRAETVSSRPSENGDASVPVEPPAIPVDTGLFDAMDFTDVGGIFDDFDPNFQLNRVDALFTANLNPTMPLFPADWTDDSQYDLTARPPFQSL